MSHSNEPDKTNNHSPNEVPTHVGFILDGNRRWAKSKGLPKLEGHRRGYENLKTIGLAARDRGVSYVSAYIFSTENWKRSQDEVSYLMDLALDIAKNQLNELLDNGIRLRFLGTDEHIRPDILEAIAEAEERSAHNTEGTLAICFNYGGQKEIADAVRAAAKHGVDMANIDPETIQKHLYAPDIPPLDVIIRTAGEQRLSNFMLWRAAYSELVFVDTYWPEFSEQDLDAALQEYSRRGRRFGGN